MRASYRSEENSHSERLFSLHVLKMIEFTRCRTVDLQRVDAVKVVASEYYFDKMFVAQQFTVFALTRISV